MKPNLKHFPEGPGCYLMKDKIGKIIYIGKAKNLKRRVSSYFTKTQTGKTKLLVSEINSIDYVLVNSESEALILELNLIQRHRPKYNILLTDDKKYPYIVITKDVFSRVIYTRDKNLGKAFGPFPTTEAAKLVVQLINKNIPLVKCRKIPKKACLYFHIGLCLAPCINSVDNTKYNEMVKFCEKILRGENREIKEELKQKMLFESENLEYEKAIETQKLIKYLEKVSERQIVEKNLNDADVFGFYNADGALFTEVLFYRTNRLIGSVNFKIPAFLDEELETVISSFYLKLNNPIPKLILIEKGDATLLKKTLKTSVEVPLRGKKKEIIFLAKKNAKAYFDKFNASDALIKSAINALKALFSIENLNKIDIIDNSHIQGSDLVSGVVCYKNNKFSKTDYRKYKIKSFSGINDPKAMYEVVKRRYQKETADLIFVDGKDAQVKSAKQALLELNLKIPVAGLYKDKNHTTSGIYFNDQEIKLLKSSNLFLFLKKLQDEVHRFAITYFNDTHRKSLMSSALIKIPNVGKATLEKVLRALKNNDLKLESLKIKEETKKAILKVLNREDN